LSSPSPLKTNPLANLSHLLGQERYRYFCPWYQLIELIIFGYDVMRIASLSYKSIQLGIEITMDDKCCVVPMVLADSI
jgi:hypothetical protein